jgi:acetyltransferase-like isoleucine patch superfamily enzyme
MSPLRSVKNKIDTDPQHSDQKGLVGLYEMGIRRFKTLGSLSLFVPFYCLAALCLGLALLPGVTLYHWSNDSLQSYPMLLRNLGLGVSLAIGFILFGFSLLFILPTLNFLLRTSPKPWKGPYYSSQTIPWGIHNALTYVMRYTFLEYLTPTPFNILFYKMMGMKIGKNVQINTTHISDPCLIEMEDHVTIGGSATIIAHYAQGGILILAPVKIKRGATVGLKATILGGVEIGEKAKILPNSFVLPKTKIPAGETWGGVPAQKIDVSLLRTARRTRKKSA